MTLFDKLIGIFWPLQMIYYLCIIVGVFVSAVWDRFAHDVWFLSDYGWFGVAISVIYLVTLYPLFVHLCRDIYKKLGWKWISRALIGDGGLAFMVLLTAFPIGFGLLSTPLVAVLGDSFNSSS